jgi:beta-mannosidase
MRIELFSRALSVLLVFLLNALAWSSPVPSGTLDNSDRRSFRAGPSPLESEPQNVVLNEGPGKIAEPPPSLSLDGTWQMAEGGDEDVRLNKDWNDAIDAAVPGSVHAALVTAGKIPNPTVGLNDVLARAKSFKTWWFRRDFDWPADKPARLSFGGVAIRCTVWLNSRRLGSHEGMFGGPEFLLTRLLSHNVLTVKIDPAPYLPGDGFPNDFFNGLNVGWTRTVVFNNCYGWHYCNIPALGLWRSVRMDAIPDVSIHNVFVATTNSENGVVDIIGALETDSPAIKGSLSGTITGENFRAQPMNFSCGIESTEPETRFHLRVKIPDRRLWWPNDLGSPDLYRLQLSFSPDGGGMSDQKQTTFGIRTIQMAPWPGGPDPTHYNWTFVINGRPTFVKGVNWCTMDPLMDFSLERYDRFLNLAQAQHIQILRAWGSGMPETDTFYDLCDRKGIMVMQEWPTAWNSQDTQPYSVLEETVRLNTLRLRNHPALVMYGAGNESSRPFGEVIDMMGRYAIELDGTRPFHRGEPWGGSRHDYTCWWGRAPLDNNLNMVAGFWGEFGIAALPAYDSVMRYLPRDDQAWPPPETGSLAHHTPVFNTKDDMARLRQYSGYYAKPDNLKDFILGSQMAQAVAVRHTLERARTRWPDCSGAIYYKLNDNYPAASWSCVDWYGAPKISYYINRHSFAPLHACLLFTTTNLSGKGASLPVFLLDDGNALDAAHWEVDVRVFDASLSEIVQRDFSGSGSIDRVAHVGDLTLSADQTQSAPLFFVIEIRANSAVADRTFYWMNCESKQGCLMQLPPATLRLTHDGDKFEVTNTSSTPAVGVNLQRPGHADTFLASDNYFWLAAGKSQEVTVDNPDGVTVEAWNAANQSSAVSENTTVSP